MIGAMQTVEFAQHGSRCRACFGLAQTSNQELDARAKDKRFLLLQRRPAAAGEDAAKNGDQPGNGYEIAGNSPSARDERTQ